MGVSLNPDMNTSFLSMCAKEQETVLWKLSIEQKSFLSSMPLHSFGMLDKCISYTDELSHKLIIYSDSLL